ncbi:MAG: hypothetical protein AB1Z20_19350, partial [Desulfobacterales bacterium]
MEYFAEYSLFPITPFICISTTYDHYAVDAASTIFQTPEPSGVFLLALRQPRLCGIWNTHFLDA